VSLARVAGPSYARFVTGTALELEPLDATFGAVVRGIDVRALDDDTWPAFHTAWIEYALLIFPGQFLTRDEQDEFAGRFGDLEFRTSPLTNIGRDGTVRSDPASDVIKSLRGNEGWHHDSTYMPVQAKGAVFTAEIVPPDGAATGWADMRAAYDALDDDTRSLVAGLSAYHSLYYSQGRAGYLPSEKNDRGGYDMYGYHDGEPSLRPLVKTHPETGRPNLLIGRHAYGIPGMDPLESERLLDRLADEACRPPRVYFHQWEVGEAVVWDNRRLMHRATPFDMTQPRRMWHTRIAGDRHSELASNLT
jgi:alpha-ketoglutarate-dependent taurine dioxygenase